MTAASSKATLLGLGLLFLFPLVVAWLMYSGIIDYRPGKTSNRGTLVQPPVHALWPDPFSRIDLDGHWILLYALPEVCRDECATDLEGVAQVRRALGRDGDRVRSVHLSPVPIDTRMNAPIEPGAFRLWDSSGKLPAQLREIGGSGTYVVDPLGNIMMYYEPGASPDDIRHDLERLLKYGKTDPQ